VSDGEEIDGSAIGPDGVETVVRTRRIAAPVTQAASQTPVYMDAPYPLPPVVMTREQWLNECGRRIADRTDRGLFSRRSKIEARARRECQATLDSYLTQFSPVGPRYASRSIPSQSPTASPIASQAYAADPQRLGRPTTLVATQYVQQQRVIVRETVREEIVPPDLP